MMSIFEFSDFLNSLLLNFHSTIEKSLTNLQNFETSFATDPTMKTFNRSAPFLVQQRSFALHKFFIIRQYFCYIWNDNFELISLAM